MMPVKIRLIIICMTLLLSNCISQSPGPMSINSPPPVESQPQSQPQSQQESNWSITLHSTCSTGAVEECVAAYDFSVNANGRYLIGPGPQKQTLSGSLTVEEFKTIEQLQLFDHNALAYDNASLICTSPIPTQTTDSVTLHQKDRDLEIIQAMDSKFCYNESLIDKAKPLYSHLKELATQHYPLPFPQDSCTDALIILEKLYQRVRECKVDPDCIYVEKAFESVPRDAATFITANDCSMVKPLIVANENLTAANQIELFEHQKNALTACKHINTTLNCGGFSHLQPTQPSPICQAGVCHPPSVPELF